MYRKGIYWYKVLLSYFISVFCEGNERRHTDILTKSAPLLTTSLALKTEYWALNRKIKDKDRKEEGPCCCYDNRWAVIISVASLSAIVTQSGHRSKNSGGVDLKLTDLLSRTSSSTGSRRISCRTNTRWCDALIVTHSADSAAHTSEFVHMHI